MNEPDYGDDPEGYYSPEDYQREIRRLRRIICIQSVKSAYMDDGEASYGGSFALKVRPFDFLRSNSIDIEKFLREYHLACYNFEIENEAVLKPAP
jgi:hypothetical protein